MRKILFSVVLLHAHAAYRPAGQASSSCEPHRQKFDQLSLGDHWTKIAQVLGRPSRQEDASNGDTVYVYELSGCTLTFRAGPTNALVAKEANPPLTARPERAAPATAKDAAVRVGNGVSAPVVLYKVDPEYSEEARKAALAGTVVLQLVVDSSGHARDFRVVRSLGLGLDEKAIEAVNKWKFRPGYRDGQPVAVEATIEVNFRLLEDDSAPKPPEEAGEQHRPVPAATSAEQISEPTRTAESPVPPPSTVIVAHLRKGIEASKRGDYATALAEYSWLAREGNPYAQNNLGSLYYHGNGVAQDHVKAVDWYMKAAKAGVSVAYNNLGHCYQKAHGVQRDYVKAQMWFMLAGPPNDAEDIAARADVLANTTTVQRNQAWNIAVEWLGSTGRGAFIHSVATADGIIPEKAVNLNGTAVYATATRSRGFLWSSVTVWNVETQSEVSVDPQRFWVVLTDDNTSSIVRATPPRKAVSAGRTAATIQALAMSLGSNRRTAAVSGVDPVTGNIYSGTVTYNDPELERERAEAAQKVLDRQAAAEQQAASVLLWPTVLRPTYYIRGGVEFRRFPKGSIRILMGVPVNGVVYSFPFTFQGKDHVGR
jgi:TonB family protein